MDREEILSRIKRISAVDLFPKGLQSFLLPTGEFVRMGILSHHGFREKVFKELDLERWDKHDFGMLRVDCSFTPDYTPGSDKTMSDLAISAYSFRPTETQFRVLREISLVFDFTLFDVYDADGNVEFSTKEVLEFISWFNGKEY